MRILGIETSCDETSLAVLERSGDRFSLRGYFLSSQVKTHAQYGGVVPEVAARLHAETILPALDSTLRQARCSLAAIDVIAVTAGPGLTTSLLVGVELARTLAWAKKIPVVAVNHLEGHLYANCLPDSIGKSSAPNIKFPALGFIVSGGHTELVLMRDHGRYRILGATRDDAAGEAFDKVGKLLDLGYPGGPYLSQLAERGNPEQITLPRPMLNSSDLDFSFAGLKTAARYYIDRHRMTPKAKADLAASFECAAVDVLVCKAAKALKQYRVRTFLLAGGVAANRRLRLELARKLKRRFPEIEYAPPNLAYCGDNAAMIAAAGYFHAKRRDFTPWEKLDADPNWELGKPQSQ